jgi:hypothetical protein
MAEFYKNLKILSQDLYKKSAVAQTNFNTRGSMSAASGVGGNFFNNQGPSSAAGGASHRKSRGGASRMSSAAEGMADSASLALLALGGMDDSMASPMTVNPVGSPKGTAENAFQTHPVDYFSNDSLYDRMKQYAQQGGIPMEYLERYAATKGGNTQG